MTPCNLEEVDTGVRQLVTWLRAMSFDTTDSGDGVSKPAAERTLDVPHVFMVGHVATVLQRRLAIAGHDPKPGRIQYTYDPADNVHVVALYMSDAELGGVVCTACGGNGRPELLSICKPCVGTGIIKEGA